METGSEGGWGPLGALPVVFSGSFSLPRRERGVLLFGKGTLGRQHIGVVVAAGRKQLGCVAGAVGIAKERQLCWLGCV